MKAKKTKTFNLPPRPPLCQLKKPLHMLYNVSMLKCGDNRLCCAGKRPLPAIPFLHCALLTLHVGNHITTPCFFHSLRGRDGAMEPMQQHHYPMPCNSSATSHLSFPPPLILIPSSSSLSFFLSCPCLHKTTPTRTNAPRP